MTENEALRRLLTMSIQLSNALFNAEVEGRINLVCVDDEICDFFTALITAINNLDTPGIPNAVGKHGPH